MAQDDTLVQAAIAAIDEVFSDTSVDLRTTLDRLEELESHIDMCKDAVRADIRRAEG